MRKEIHLLVLEEEQLAAKSLVEIDSRDYIINLSTYYPHWDSLGMPYKLTELVDKFKKINEESFRLFRPRFAKNSEFPLYEKILDTKLTLASADAYADLTKDMEFARDEGDTKNQKPKFMHVCQIV